MKCNICDKDLSDKEVVFNKELETFEPCSECLEIIMEAAFGDNSEEDDYVLIPYNEFDGDANDILDRYKDVEE